MPHQPLGPCAIRTCPGRATHGRYCARHAGENRPRDERPSAARRGYGRQWRRIRASYLRRHPDCEVCGQPAVEVDHIIPRAAGGGDQDDNLQALCKTHHSQKTAREDGGFGRRREGG